MNFSSSMFVQQSIYIIYIEVNFCVCVGMDMCLCAHIYIFFLKNGNILFNYHRIGKICCLYWATPGSFRRTCDVIFVSQFVL